MTAGASGPDAITHPTVAGSPTDTDRWGYSESDNRDCGERQRKQQKAQINRWNFLRGERRRYKPRQQRQGCRRNSNRTQAADYAKYQALRKQLAQ